MREILYRGIHPNMKQFITGLPAYGLDGEINMLHDGPNDYYDVLPETVGQFTGLKDKNGKKIFEGDIVGVNAVLGHGYGRKILFRNGCFGFEAIPNVSEDLCYLEVWTEDVEIIGNIHQNADLLKA